MVLVEASNMDFLSADLGLAIIRVVIGGIFFAHGLQKVGYLGGNSPSGTAAWLENKLSFRPGSIWAAALIGAELGGGILLVIGFLGALAPFVLAADMVVAASAVHLRNGFWNMKGGIEFNLAMGGAALGLGFTGFGAWSLDEVLALAWPAWWGWLWLVAAGFGVVAAIATRATSGEVAASG
jgi:putative oxidoreductase